MAGEYLLAAAAAATGIDGIDDVGFDDVEEAMPWLLPTHILDEACGYPTTIIHHRHTNYSYYSSKGRGQRHGKVNHNHGDSSSSSAHPITNFQNIKPRTTKPNRHHHRHPRQVVNNNIMNGGGMRAIFLDKSGNKSSTPRGTGVFLPRQPGSSHVQNPPCSPVLLPSRVVQALNLNIHQLLRLQISPQKDIKNNKHYNKDEGESSSSLSSLSSSSSSSLSSDQDTNKLLIEEQNSTHPLLHQRQDDQSSHIMKSSSPELFLPKEWSY